ncbi:hypothetical protein [Candidatus Phytoplasma meliae]|uniref:Integral membrane protein n=1 Tax=Candidatus Phytoplasma meliae TaxID=1848402 RepID=A0ABS5CY06_9MOLU|nr:hypothetical protein [Candidatus Phytoplasma meliae]MBP5835862.1 hypothetical protein [Candidatus Phytoplasma meliae]
MLQNQKNILKKIIATSFLLFLAFFVEIISRYTINLNSPCDYSLFKIELVFIILIGFLFGFKYSFCSSLTYLLIHYAFEYFIMELLINSHTHSHEEHHQYSSYLIFFYRFFIPYLICSFSGIFYQKETKKLFTSFSLIITLSIISIVQIIASILFINLIKEHFLEHQTQNLVTYFFSNDYSFAINVIYSVLSVIINNLIIGVTLYLINRHLLNKLDFWYSLKKD